ncbi:MAG TPA: DUF4232 domain-containing protein [Trebonia sp.]|jgi:hypothetical protein|nr:DUF4232 domain-containing protein [Trebonia sp.]
MRASVRLGWRVAAVVAFAATAALAVTLTRGAPTHAALTSARHLAREQGASGTPACATATLRISVGAGTSPADRAVALYRLEFTNVSGAACTLSGYPQVAAYRGDGALVGNAAGRDTSAAARRVLLAPGATAHAAVIASVSAGPCRPMAAAGLRVVPPGQSAASYVPHVMRACSAAGPRAPVYLRVRAIQPGAGTAAPGPGER